MKYIFFFLSMFAGCVFAQDKSTKKLVKDLQEHIGFLADDKLEGRRAGSHGEQLAYEYISKQFKKAGLSAVSGNYLQPFDINDGKQITGNTSLSVAGATAELNTYYFPLSYSGNGTVRLTKTDGEQYTQKMDIGPLLLDNTTNPHFDLNAAIIAEAEKAKKNGKKVLLVSNSSSIADNLRFDEKDKTPAVLIPVIYINDKAYRDKKINNPEPSAGIVLTIDIQQSKRTGHNVIGFINNNAANTVVLGAHYDHLGYGEDHNSLYTGSDKQIHNGADDNASGTAALIELAKMIRSGANKNSNYLFIAFSGEELGLYGSKYFVEHMPAGIGQINYMINMDMVGRLNDSTHGISIGGYGTSPAWHDLVPASDPLLKIKFDSSGSGPSDHTSFYRKDIPVLFFFTGTHKDYHKPTDDADKINYTGEAAVISYIYNIIDRAGTEKIAFTKTREAATAGKSSFKVSLGIMPDYTFDGNGVLVDGVSEGRTAQKAGIKAGDVLYQLGDYKFSDVQTYMNALNKFNKGESTKVKALRGKEELVFDVTF